MLSSLANFSKQMYGFAYAAKGEIEVLELKVLTIIYFQKQVLFALQALIFSTISFLSNT